MAKAIKLHAVKERRSLSGLIEILIEKELERASQASAS